jgi:hypothetical protein
MTCEAYAKSLGAMIAGDPSPEAADHERSCASCAKKRRSMEDCLVAIGQIPRPSVPAGLSVVAMAKIAQLSPPWQKPVTPTVTAKAALGWAAAALVTAAVVGLATHRPSTSPLLSQSGAVKETHDAAGYHVKVPAAGRATVRLSPEAVVELEGPGGLSIPTDGPPFIESGSADVRVSGNGQGFHVRTPHLEVTCAKGSYGVNVGTVSTVKAESSAVDVDANGRRHHLNAGEEYHTTPPTSLATGDAGSAPNPVKAAPVRADRPHPGPADTDPPPTAGAGVSGHPVDLPSSLQNLDPSGQRPGKPAGQ